MRDGRLPNLVIIGAMKAGTTTLHGLLSRHPEIFMSREKELHFFSMPTDRRRSLDWYKRHFRSDRRVRGETSPSYAAWPRRAGVAEAIFETIPDARIVYCVRDPIDRAVSHYKHALAQGLEIPPVDKGIFGEPFLRQGRYATQIERYFLAGFPQGRIHFVQSEVLRRDRGRVLTDLYRFLGVDPDEAPPAFQRDWHKSDRKRVPTARGRHVKHRLRPALERLPWSIRSHVETAALLPFSTSMPRIELAPATVERLQEVFADEAARLRALTGQTFAGWKV